MSKTKTKVKVTIEVMGKELTVAEAEALYLELKTALNKSDPKPITIFPDSYPLPRTYIPWLDPQKTFYSTSTSTSTEPTFSADELFSLTGGSATTDGH